MLRFVFYTFLSILILFGAIHLFTIEIPMYKAKKEMIAYIETQCDGNLVASQKMSWSMKSVHFYMDVTYKDEEFE